MQDAPSPHWVYNETVRRFAAEPEPAFETPGELAGDWGRPWGVENDVGRMRAVMVHRPGEEMRVIDPAKRIPEIGSYGDEAHGWYFQSETIPELADMQAQHDAMVAALEGEGVEVMPLDGVGGGRLKSCYTRDPFIMVKGGAIVCRMGTRIRRGEVLPVTRTLAALGVPILRTLSGTAVFEGGSFAWLDEKTAVAGVGVRVNREGARQVAQVLETQGVELIVIELSGYDIHIDVSFLMVDRDLALIDPMRLPHGFLAELSRRGIRTVEIGPGDDPWIVNSLAVAPRRLLMPEGASNRTLDRLAAEDVTWATIPYDAMQLNGGGIHCSTMPLIRDAA